MRNVDRPLDVDEVCSKTVDFEKLLWIARKKGWEDATPRCEDLMISFSDSEIEEWSKSIAERKGYWKNRWEKGAEEWSPGFKNIPDENRSSETKDWLIDQARIRHIKRKYYTAYSTNEATDWFVLKKSTTHNLLWIVLGFPVCLTCVFLLFVEVGELLDQPIPDHGGPLALAGFFFGFMTWLAVLIAWMAKQHNQAYEFELVDLQCIMLEYLDEIGMRPEWARELTPEEVRGITSERRRVFWELHRFKSEMRDLLNLKTQEIPSGERRFARERIGKEIDEIENVRGIDEQWITDRVKRMDEEVFSDEW